MTGLQFWPKYALEDLLDAPYLTTARRIECVEELPLWEDVVQLYEHLKGVTKIGYRVGWSGFCHSINVHHVFNHEFVESLAEEIRKLGINGPIVEVCAGNGKLSYWLSQSGIPVTGTDNYSYKGIKRNAKHVKRLSHKQALKRYNPELVIGCWLPGGGIELDVLDYPSVKHYLDIGEGRGGCTGDEGIYERTDVTEKLLESTIPYGLSRAYTSVKATGYRSFASLFSKRGQFQ